MINSELIEKINQHLLNPKSYITLEGKFVYFGKINNLSFDVDFLDENIRKDLQPYTNKYDVNSYNGHIHFSIEGEIISLYYKDKIIMQDSETNRNNKNFKNIFRSIISDLDDLFQCEDELSRLSFELKEKDILNQLIEFYRSFYLDPEKSYIWIKENIK